MRINFIFMFLSIAFVISGCSASIEQNSSPTSITSDRPTISPSIVVDTETSVPVTITPTPFAPLNLTPTLTPKERESYLLEYFSSETNCKFPCWLGATPGVTTFSEFRFTLQKLGIRYSPIDVSSNQKQEIELGGMDFDSKQILNDIKVIVEPDDGISGIKGILHAYLNPAGFAESWDVIDIRNLLLGYGVPSKITIKTDYNDITGRVGYSVGVNYIDKGFAVYYNGGADYQSTTRICPYLKDYQIITIGFSLQNPPFKEESNSVENFYTEFDTGLSVNELYTLFTGSTKPCLIISSEELK